MSNRRVVEQLILRRKCAPSTAGQYALIGVELANLLQEYTLRESGWWGFHPGLTPNEDLVCLRGGAIGLDRAGSCTFYQHRSHAADPALLEDALRDAVYDPLWVGSASGGPWGPTWPNWQLTPEFSLHNWPSWLTGLLYLAALTRPEWAYVALYGGRAWSPDWRRELAEACFGSPDSWPAVRQAQQDLEEIAGQLQDARNAALAGRVQAPWYAALDQLRLQAAALPTWNPFAGAVRGWLNATTLDTSPLGQALASLRQVLAPPADPVPALDGLLRLSRPGGAFWDPGLCGALSQWLQTLPAPAGSRGVVAWFASWFRRQLPPDRVIQRILLLRGPASPDVVMTRDRLLESLTAQFGSLQPHGFVISELFQGRSIDAMAAGIGSFLGSPANLRALPPGDWWERAGERAGHWLSAPPFNPANPNGWSFEPEIATSVQGNPGDLQQAGAWLATTPPAANWPAAGAGRDALCNLFLSVCLEDLVEGMQASYRTARRGI
jgi:hypothetical protein